MTDVAARLNAALSDRYVVERELGAGGMATVYLAQDLRHDRKVALKVLRAELAAVIGAERFLAEIRTTANLQHPHILPLFDSGEADGLVYYVMPYVEGESLRDRLTREKQLPVEDAVRIVTEVADALQYAHTQGIVHRDIKPENILLHGGHALVADFGIALAAARSEGGTRLTETGMSLGTPHYMAPEQAMGEREITPKADIYALGCVLYEMLTAEPPFTGATAQAIIARVMTEAPRSLTLQRKTVPPHVEAAVLAALEKLPADRPATAAAFAEALERPGVSIATARAAGVAAAPGALRRRVVLGAPWLVAALAVAALTWVALRRPRLESPPVTRFDLSFDRGATPLFGVGTPIALSPDGARIVFVGSDSSGTSYLFVRNLDKVEPVKVPGTAGAGQPFFSPDGRWLGFLQDGNLRKVALAGGAVVTICDVGGEVFGASWGSGDVIVFSMDGRLRRVSASGGQPSDVAVPDSSRHEALRFPDVLPGARAAVFVDVTDSGPALKAVTLADGRVTALGLSAVSPHYVDGGYLAFTEMDGTLFAVPFDARRLRLAGSPQPVTDHVLTGGAGVGKVGLARSGALAYLSESAQQLELALVGRDGRVVVLPTGGNRYSGPRFSPDGRRIAVMIVRGGRVTSAVRGDIWVWDLSAGSFQRITFDTSSGYPEWMPDGRRIAYVRQRGTAVGLYTIRADGSGQPESLLVGRNPIDEASITLDGRRVVFLEINPAKGGDIWIAPLDSPSAARPLLVTPFDERSPAISPDGRWLAYASNETGAFEVYVRGLEEGSGRTRVSTGGGAEPRWARSGRELFYRKADSIYVVPVLPGSGSGFGPPHAIVRTAMGNGFTTDWDVSPDGKSFLVVRRPDEATQATQLHVLLHWFDALAAGRH